MKVISESANEAAARLAVAIMGEDCYTPDTVPPGFAPMADIAKEMPPMTIRGVQQRLTEMCRAGRFERVAVKPPGARWGYWYRAKK